MSCNYYEHRLQEIKHLLQIYPDTPDFQHERQQLQQEQTKILHELTHGAEHSDIDDLLL